MLRLLISLFFTLISINAIGQKSFLNMVFKSADQDNFYHLDIVESKRNTYCILTENGIYLETSLEGDILVSKEYKNPSTKNYYSPITFAEMIPSKTNGNLLLGWARIDSTKSKPIFVLKTDKNGNTIWNKTLDMPDYYPSAIIQDADSNILITGDSYSKDHSIFLAKLDKEGNQIWVKTYGAPGNKLFIPNLKSLADSSIVLMGTVEQKVGNNWKYASFITNLSSTGNILWARKVIPSKSSRHVQVHDLVETKNGLYFLKTQSYKKGILHTTKKGDLKWANFHYTSNTPDFGYQRPIKLNYFDKKLFSFVTGTCAGGALSILDTTGKLIGNHYGRMEGMDVIKPNPLDFIMVGIGPICGSKNFYESEIVFAEIDNDMYRGCTFPDEINQIEDSVSIDTLLLEMIEVNDSITGNLNLTTSNYPFKVSENCAERTSNVNSISLTAKVFPNPARESLTFEFNSTVSGTIEVFNFLGVRMYSSAVNSGSHTVDVSTLQPGVYIYKLSTAFGDLTDKFFIESGAK